jgi:hypothetical protein
MPRNQELDPSVDFDARRAAYMRQMVSFSDDSLFAARSLRL